MFDLKKAIWKWTKTLAAHPGLEDGHRAELESSLRDEIADLIDGGWGEEEAFQKVTGEMGSPEDMAREFFKVYSTSHMSQPLWIKTRFTPALIWNYIKITLRKIRRQKGYSLISIAGLTVGLACCAVMLLWVNTELSFDRFHANFDSIYRVIKKTPGNDGDMLDARTPYPLGPAVLGTVPEVYDYCRYQGFELQNLQAGDKRITVPNFLGTADASFFQMFTFPFLEGDPKTALDDRRSIVLTESMALGLFGEKSPMGETVTYIGWGDFKVTGVIRDIPENSHIRFDVMMPIKEIAPGRDIGENDWGPLFFYTYIQLAPNVTAGAAATKIAAVLNENLPQAHAEILLQPMKDVHLRSHFQWDMDNYAQGSQSSLIFFTLAALGVLFLAIINFMNLSTARSAARAKEVGLRKVSGARRSEITGQFLGESVIQAFLALLIALILVQAVLPLFNALSEKSVSFTGLFHPQTALLLLGVTLLTGLIAGIYPAFYMSAFQPAAVLKGVHLSKGRGHASIRKGLVVFQFALTLFLVIGLAVIDRQLHFIEDKDLGIDTENVVNFFGDFGDLQRAKEAFLANPNILSITRSAPPFREQRGRTDVHWEGKNPTDETSFFPVIVDPDYLETFRIELSEGRFFSHEIPSDEREALVLNQTAVRAIGMAEPVGKRVTIGEHPYTIIGVIRDFHQSSLHKPIEPMIFWMPSEFWQICARISPVNIEETLAYIEETSETLNPRLAQIPFRFTFLDETIHSFYAAERKMKAILGLYTAIALFTACLGLFGLASFLAEKRTKELGIRKVLGAPVSSLVLLQTKEFTKWILFAGIIAAPAAYFASTRWLQGFAYHIHPDLGIFIVSIVTTLAVALLAVGFQSIRAARANPADSLRYE